MASPGRLDDAAILFTGVGKRYDIVSAFAQHATVIAADPNPLADRPERPYVQTPDLATVPLNEPETPSCNHDSGR